MKKVCIVLTAAMLILAAAAIAQARSTGQLVFVPAYSHIYQGPRNAPLDLTVHLLVHNLSQEQHLKLLSVEYRDQNGALVQEYIQSPVSVSPLGAWNLVVPEKDDTGDLGSSFLVRWQADSAIREPMVETIMVSTKSQLGVSFRSEGRVLKELDK